MQIFLACVMLPSHTQICKLRVNATASCWHCSVSLNILDMDSEHEAQ